MKKLNILFILPLAAALFLSSNIALGSECRISTAFSLPYPEGHGNSAAFIGNVNDAVIMAGGSDFLGARPWEGGTKSYFDDIRIIRKSGNSYECIESPVKLPFTLGGGCSASTGKALYCIGGKISPTEVSDKVLKLSLVGDDVSVSEFCTLPENFIPAGAEYFKGEIYIHGTEHGENRFYSLNLSSGKFTALPACPGSAIEEGCSLVHCHDGREDALFLIGGRSVDADGIHIAGNVKEYLTVHNTWEEKAAFNDDGVPLSLMYSPAIKYGSAHILVFGGDDGVEFLRRDSLSRAGDAEALTEAFANHPGFTGKIYAYHTITDTWITLSDAGSGLPVVTSAVKLGDSILIPSGEVRPGVRCPEVLEAKVEDKASFGTFNYVVVVLYLLAMLGVGFYFSRRNSGTEKFFKGGGNIPWWAAGISIFATALSAITFLSIPAKAYSADWGMFMFNMTIIMVVPIVINFFLPLFRKLNVASVYQYLEDRFSGAVRLMASAFFVFFMFTRIAIVLFLPSLALNAVTGINIYVCIGLMGIVTIIYCTMGGIEAVVWGDVIQGFLLVGGALVSLIWIICGLDGGIGTYFNVAIEESKFNILNFSLDWTKPVFWVAIIGGISNQLLTYTSDQSVVQKYMTVKDEKGTRRGLWLNGILSIPIAFLFFGIGTGLFVFFKQNPELLSVSMSNTDSIFPHYIMCKLPVGISGLLIAAVFAAAMSTLASNINSSTTVMSVDFYSRIFKDAADTRKVRFARIAGIIVGGLGVAMAMVLATFDIASLWDQFNFFLGLLTSGLGGLFMMGIFTKRIGPRSAITGFVGSVVVLILCNNFTNITSILYGFIGLVACFVIGLLSSYIFGYKK